MTAVISACIFFSIKSGEFLCRYFNTEDGRKKATFSTYYTYYFKKGKNATETQRKICAVFGEGAVTDQTRRKWFAKFHAGDFPMDDAWWSSRPVEDDSDQETYYTTWKIADIVKISKSSVENHLHQLGYANCFDVWVPRKLLGKKPSWLYIHMWFSTET